MGYTPLVDTIFSGNPRVPTADPGDNDTTIANTAFVTAATSFYVPKEGGVTLTGDLTFGENADIIMDNTSVLTLGDVTISRAEAGVLTLDAGDQLRVAQDPVHDNDLARKAYVDSVAMGLDVKASVRVASQANLDLSGPGAAIDGVSLSNGDRVLVKAQDNAEENGIYVFNGAAAAMARAGDANADVEVTAGMFTFVEEGTNADQGWVLVTNNPIDLDVTELAFAQFSNAVIVNTLDSLTDVAVDGAVDGAILRYEASSSSWEDTSVLLLDDNGQLKVTTEGSNGGIMLGGDAQLYRSAADVLRTPDSLEVGADSGKDSLALTATGADVGITIGGDTNLYRSAADTLKTDDSLVSAGAYISQRGTTGFIRNAPGATDNALLIKAQADTQYRFGADASGKMFWGAGGTDTPDANLYRHQAGLLQTDSALSVQGKMIAGAAQRVKVSAVKTANYTASLSADYVIRCDSNGGAMEIALPAGHYAGDCFVIKDVGGDAEEHAITINPDGSETIEGAASFALSVNHQSVMVISDGTNWIVV